MEILATVGNALFAVAFLVIGPAPFFDFDPSVWLISVCTILCGIAAGFITVTAVSRATERAVDKGYKNDITTFLAISGQQLQTNKAKDAIRCVRVRNCRGDVVHSRGLVHLLKDHSHVFSF